MPKKTGKSAPKRAAKPKSAPKKPAPKKAASPATRKAVQARSPKPRRIRLGKYNSFRLQKRIKHPVRLPSIWRITKKSILLLRRHWRLFGGITLIYGIINLVLAQGIGGTDVSSLKDSFDKVFTGNFGFVPTSLSIFAVLIGTAGNTNSQTAGAYQIFLALICSLAIIWTLRQVTAGGRPRVRDSFYRGMTPLIPFVLVLLVVGLELVPLIVGSGLYGIVVNNGIAVYPVERILWALLFGMLGLLTLYLLTSSLFALYIVTLPNMTPMKALRSARGLVRHRRWTVLRKLLGLPVVLLVIAGVIMLPIIALLTPVAQWVFFILTMIALVLIHAYVYTLYRELLNE